MSKSSTRALIIGCLVLLFILCGAIGWTVFTANSKGTELANSLGQLQQLPVESQGTTIVASAPNVPVVPVTTVVVPETAPASGLPTSAEISQLEAIGQAIDAYKEKYQKYPDSLDSLDMQALG